MGFLYSRTCTDLPFKHLHSCFFSADGNTVLYCTKGKETFLIKALLLYLCASLVSKTLVSQKLFNIDAFYSVSSSMLLWLHTTHMTHTHMQKLFTHHVKSDSPSRISWLSPPWRLSCEGPAVSLADVWTSSWSSELLRLPLADPSDATAAPQAPLSALTARQHFPSTKQLPHPEPLPLCISQQVDANKNKPVPLSPNPSAMPPH